MLESEENSPQENPTPDDGLLVYIAKNLKDAQRLEEAFTQAGLDYDVEPDEYVGGLIFRRTLIGAFFYVAESDAEAARNVMKREGFRIYQP